MAESRKTAKQTARPDLNGHLSADDDDHMPESSGIDWAKLAALLLAYPRAHRAIKREAQTDKARHGYFDIMLAEIGLLADWTDDEIVALIREGNIQSGLPMPSIGYCHVMTQQARLKTKRGDLDMAREALLMNLSTAWKIEIQAVIRHGTENSLWHLKLINGQEIQLGTTEQLTSQQKVRTKIFDSTGHMIPRYSPRDVDKWDYHLSLLYDAALIVDTPELTREGQIVSIILHYVESQSCDLAHESSREDIHDAARDHLPFVREGILYISPKNLWLISVRMYYPKMTNTELLDLLRLIGGRRLTIALNGSEKTSRSYWRIPVKRLQQIDLTTETITTDDGYDEKGNMNDENAF